MVNPSQARTNYFDGCIVGGVLNTEYLGFRIFSSEYDAIHICQAVEKEEAAAEDATLAEEEEDAGAEDRFLVPVGIALLFPNCVLRSQLAFAWLWVGIPEWLQPKPTRVHT